MYIDANHIHFYPKQGFSENKTIYYKHQNLTPYFTLISTPAGTTTGRNEREWGQIGVMTIAGTLGWTMEAPAATA